VDDDGTEKIFETVYNENKNEKIRMLGDAVKEFGVSVYDPQVDGWDEEPAEKFVWGDF